MTATPTPTDLPEALAKVQFLCQAWGETDFPAVAIVTGLDAVRQFLISQWLGSADKEADDGTNMLDDAMQGMLVEWELEGPAWKWGANFEIGGVSVQRVADFSPAAPTTEQSSEVAQAGLPMSQEPKYTVTRTHIVNRASGEAVPHDEPVFVFRARDALGVRALEAYLVLIGEREPSSMHADAVRGRIADFQRFASAHPDRMKWPDTATAPRAGAESYPPLPRPAWDKRTICTTGDAYSDRQMRAYADATAALRARGAVPSGWKLVPVEPTIAMCIAGDAARLNESDVTRSAPAYRAMLAAAPQPPAAMPGEQDARDAARYRWLRGRPSDWSVEHYRNGWSTCYGRNELDAAVDAAMAAAKEQQ